MIFSIVLSLGKIKIVFQNLKKNLKYFNFFSKKNFFSIKGAALGFLLKKIFSHPFFDVWNSKFNHLKEG